MKAILFLLLFLLPLHATLIATAVEGEVQQGDPLTRGTVSPQFIHRGSALPVQSEIQTGKAGFLLAEDSLCQLLLLPGSRVSLHREKQRLQLMLLHGECYLAAPRGGADLLYHGGVARPRGTAHLTVRGTSVNISAVKGGAQLFRTASGGGEILPKGYSMRYDDSTTTRHFYYPKQRAMLRELLPCQWRPAFGIKRCPPADTSQDTFALEIQLPPIIVDGQLFIAPFTIAADNNFPMDTAGFLGALAAEQALIRFGPRISLEPLFATLRTAEQQGQLDYFVLEGSVHPAGSSAARCAFALYSGAQERYLLRDSITFALVDDYTTGGLAPEPALGDSIGLLLEQYLPQIKSDNDTTGN